MADHAHKRIQESRDFVCKYVVSFSDVCVCAEFNTMVNVAERW